MAIDRNNPFMTLFAKHIDRFYFIFDIFLTNRVEVASDFSDEDLLIKKGTQDKLEEADLI